MGEIEYNKKDYFQKWVLSECSRNPDVEQQPECDTAFI